MFDYYIESYRKMLEFKGRARRKEYLSCCLIDTIIHVLVAAICMSVYYNGSYSYQVKNEYGAILALIIILIPYGIWAITRLMANFSLQVRRFQDMGMPGGLILFSYVLFFIPVLNLISSFSFFIVLACVEGQKGENKYGKDPKAEEKI